MNQQDPRDQQDTAAHASADQAAGRWDPQPGDGESTYGEDRHVETGLASVDAVLSSLVGLEQRPVDEHVAVFETAHEQLRAALSDAGDRNPG